MDGMTRTPTTTSQTVVSGNHDSVDAIIFLVLQLLVHPLIADRADDLYNLCISLARAINHAIASNQVPTRASKIPLLLKQLCQFVDPMLQAATMVLMCSVKYACKNRWFSDEDVHEILILAAELEKIFSSSPNPDNDPRSYLPTISKIMSRFCPRMKMGHIIGFLVVKPGYDAYVIDFAVSNEENSSLRDKIYLFVAKTDDIETSKCLVTPPNVNFMLNGKGVKGRNMVSMEVGPQIPTDVTHMLQFGPNLLQVVGHFNGNYVIAIAYISMERSSAHFPISNNNGLVRQSPCSPSLASANADVARSSAHFPRSNNTGEPSRAVTKPGGAPELQSEHNWRSTGQMRGSLTGLAYSEALAMFLNPGPQYPAARSLSSLAESPPGFSPHMPTLSANKPSQRVSQGGTSGSKPEPSFR